jgi:hypothetical protein
VSAFFSRVQNLSQNYALYIFTRVDIEFLNMMPLSVNVRLPDSPHAAFKRSGEGWARIKHTTGFNRGSGAKRRGPGGLLRWQNPLAHPQ